MMGRLKSDQGQLFYEFRLGDAVPEDHMVRKIDTALDLSWLRSELAPHYSSMGRPSIDPELMIRMLVVGYVFAIRSERLICREVQVNLAYRWFCKLGIEDAVPDHSAFSRAPNERFREGDVFRRMFERVVEACIAAGLVGGEGFAVDASLIQADANKQRSIAGQDWHRDRDPARSSRAVKEYLATLDDTSWGAASEVVPKFVSPSDPAAQWTGAHKGPAFFAYSDNYLIDVKFGVIVDQILRAWLKFSRNYPYCRALRLLVERGAGNERQAGGILRPRRGGGLLGGAARQQSSDRTHRPGRSGCGFGDKSALPGRELFLVKPAEFRTDGAHRDHANCDLQPRLRSVPTPPRSQPTLPDT
jgi:transposase